MSQYDLAQVELALKRPAEARRLAEGAIDVIAKDDRAAAGHAKLILAEALWETPRDRRRALDVAADARREMVAGGARPDRVAEADAWLKSHAAP
jgi:hypothetical protein